MACIQRADAPSISHSFERRLFSAMSGFTLTELVIVVTLVGILAAIAGPAMSDFMINQRLRNAGYELITDLTFARSEAIKRASNVTVARSGSWTAGWTVTDSGGNVLRQHPSFANTISIAGSNASVIFALNGRAAAASTFTLDDADGKTTIEARCISLDTSGRPRSTMGSCS